MSTTVLIVGASARAAAHSALRAGLRPSAVDLFADLDLAAIAPTRRLVPDRYPSGLEDLASGLSPGPFLYTGALENHPDLVDRLARSRPLWGNPGAVLRAIRDPIAVSEVPRRAGLPAPSVRIDPAGLPRDGSWLVKPIRSAGGRGIRPLGPDFERSDRPCYFQERAEGPSLSAVVLADARGARLVGITRQLTGRPGVPFAYRGSLGPWPVPEALRGRIERLGRTLASAFGLVGLFGIDLIVAGGQPWPVEVNPRYTASVEVLEFGLGRPLLADHRRAFDLGLPAVAGPGAERTRAGVVGKAILFAERSGLVPDPIRWRPPRGRRPFALPTLADIPRPGTRVEVGDPILTVLARGRDARECREALRRRLRLWKARLDGVGP